MTSIIVCGATGRMGHSILQQITADSGCTLAYASNSTTPLEKGLSKGNVIIDFTLPEPTMAHVSLAVKSGKPIVIGTTGFTEEQLHTLGQAAKKIPMVLAPNMSVGVNVLWHLIGEASRALGSEFQISITETHHVHKKDKPSGTAKKMAEMVQGLHKELQVSSLREGEVIGDHRIIFETGQERLEIAHHAKTRDIFAQGSVCAAKWLIGKPAGLYDMQDVLDL